MSDTPPAKQRSEAAEMMEKTQRCVSAPGLMDVYPEAPAQSPVRRSRAALRLVSPIEAAPATLDRAMSLMLQQEGHLTFLSRGETLFRAGDSAGGLYVVLDGRVRLIDETGSGPERAELGEGAIVGAEGVYGAALRTYSVVAARDSHLLYLSCQVFERLSRERPQIALQLTRAAILQQHQDRRSSTPKPRKQALSVAIVPISPQVPLREFTARLQDALAPWGSSLVLRANSLDEHLALDARLWLEDPLDNHRVIAWLNAQEALHDVVLYEADAEDTAWTWRAVRQADHVLLVGCADADPALSRLERMLSEDRTGGLTAQRTLVLVQPSHCSQPSGTVAWLQDRTVERHHHVWLNRPVSLSRLARFLCGQATGLVLGSGGARCLAHLGVLQALTEAGISVDAIGGVSVGAVVAAQVALGTELPALLAQMKILAGRARSLVNPTLPVVSLFSATRIHHLLEDLFGDRQIEDLPLPYFCASSNLHTTELVVHRQGSLRHYLQATSAAPGVLPPVLDHGELLVDGAVRNAVPVQAMREFCGGGVVIASDVSAEVALRNDYHFDAVPSVRHLLWNRINPLAKRRMQMPSIASILLRSAELSSVHHGYAEAHTADIYIQPPVSTYRLFESRSIADLVDHGYRAAVHALEQWQRQGERVVDLAGA